MALRISTNRSVLAALSLIALTAPVHADVVELFPGAGTVRVANGTTGRIVGVTSIDRTARTVGAVIDARDRFGNAVRVNRVLRVVPDAIRSRLSVTSRGRSLCGGRSHHRRSVLRRVRSDQRVAGKTGGARRGVSKRLRFFAPERQFGKDVPWPPVR